MLFSQKCQLSIFYVCFILHPVSKASSTSETSVNFYQTTWRNNSGDSRLYTRRRENLQSHSESEGSILQLTKIRSSYCYSLKSGSFPNSICFVSHSFFLFIVLTVPGDPDRNQAFHYAILTVIFSRHPCVVHIFSRDCYEPR
jgi:hypothetical protein